MWTNMRYRKQNTFYTTQVFPIICNISLFIPHYFLNESRLISQTMLYYLILLHLYEWTLATFNDNFPETTSIVLFMYIQTVQFEFFTFI